MEEDGYVSLWIGKSESDEELSDYVELVYTDDGDCLPSQFLKDFQIDMYDFDEDFIERVCLEKEVHTVNELISECSYDNIIIPKYKKIVNKVSLEKFNAGILLFNFKYNEVIKKVEFQNIVLEYIGSVKYDE